METSLPSLFVRLRSLVTQMLRGEKPLFALVQTVGTQGLILCANLSTGIIMARWLGPDGRGEYAAVSIWPQLLAMLALSGMTSAIVFRMRRREGDSNAVVGAALIAGLGFASLAGVAGFFLLPGLLSKYSPALVWFAQLCLVSVLVNTVTMIVRQAYAGAGQFARGNFANLLPQCMHLLFLLAILPFATLTPVLAVLALLGSGFASLLLLFPGFLRAVKPRLRGAWHEMPALLSYSGRGALNEVAFTIAIYLDRLVLIPLLSPADLGLYAVAFSFSRVVQFAQPAVTSVFLSQISARDPLEGKRLHDHALRFLLAGMTLVCIALWFVGEWLLGLTFGADFGAANPIFRLLVIEAALAVLSQVTVQLFLAHNRPGVVSTLQVITLGVSLLGLLILVPRFGAMGAAGALLIAGVVRWTALQFAIRVVLRLPFPRLLLNREDLQYMSGRLS